MDREKFEGYVSSKFLEGKNLGSKVIWRSKGEKIVAVLKAKDGDGVDAHFRFWVKSRKFCVMDYPALGLKDVLCLPAKKKVSNAVLHVPLA